jgi:ABC-type Zn2+ transport system substrate-binding protein/surface adhesin
MEPVKIGSVDPVGIGVKAGPDAYFDILHHLTDNIVVQLERSS